MLDSLPAAIEYSFKTDRNGDEINVFRIYLEPNGGLFRDSYAKFRDPHAKSRLCDHDNTYLAKYVLYEVAENLLDSTVFAPL